MKSVYKILLSAGAAVLAFGLSVFSHLLLMPVLAFAAFMAVEWGIVFMLPTLALTAVGVLLTNPMDAGCAVTLAMLLLIPVCLEFFSKRKLPHRYTVLALAVIITVGMYLSMCIDSLIAGKAPYEGAVEVWEALMVAPFEDIVANGGAEYRDYVTVFKSFEDFIPDLLMPCSVAAGEALSLGLVMFFRLCYKIFKLEPQKMARLSDWRLPQNSLIGAVILALPIALAYIIGLNRANAIALSLGIIIVSMFSVQGFAYLMFFLDATKAPVILKVLLWLIPILLFPYSLIMLAIFGIKEQIQTRRALIKKYFSERKREMEAEDRSEELIKYGYIREDEESEDDGSKKNESDDNKED